MADLLTHVLVAYAVLTVLSWYVDRLTPKWVAIGAVGSMVPDLNRIGMFVSEVWVESVLGTGFRFGALSTLGGTVLLCGVGAMLFARERRFAFVVLGGGALTHLLVDAVKAWADGQAAAWLYPVTWWRHATPSLYVSADWWLAVGAVVVAGAVWSCDRYGITGPPDTPW